MIVEMRTYTLQPGAAATYIKNYQEEGLAIQRPILGHLVGYYSTEIGPLNQVIHMWGYETFEDRLVRRQKLFADKGWLAYVEKVRALIVSQETKILIPAPFFKVPPPA
jgi:hypothetical protein